MIVYQIRSGGWKSKQKRSFEEAEKTKKLVSGCLANVEITAERVSE